MTSQSENPRTMIERGVKLLGCRVRKITSSSPLHLLGGEAIVEAVNRNGLVSLQCPCCREAAGTYNPFDLEAV